MKFVYIFICSFAFVQLSAMEEKADSRIDCTAIPINNEHVSMQSMINVIDDAYQCGHGNIAKLWFSRLKLRVKADWCWLTPEQKNNYVTLYKDLSAKVHIVKHQKQQSEFKTKDFARAWLIRIIEEDKCGGIDWPEQFGGVTVEQKTGMKPSAEELKKTRLEKLRKLNENEKADDEADMVFSLGTVAQIVSELFK